MILIKIWIDNRRKFSKRRNLLKLDQSACSILGLFLIYLVLYAGERWQKVSDFCRNLFDPLHQHMGLSRPSWGELDRFNWSLDYSIRDLVAFTSIFWSWMWKWLQILCCIIGLFAVCQRRRALLAVFAITNLLSTIYNILLLLWWVRNYDNWSDK